MGGLSCTEISEIHQKMSEKHLEISSKHKHPRGHDRRFQLEKWHENHGIDIFYLSFN